MRHVRCPLQGPSVHRKNSFSLISSKQLIYDFGLGGTEGEKYPS